MDSQTGTNPLIPPGVSCTDATVVDRWRLPDIDAVQLRHRVDGVRITWKGKRVRGERVVFKRKAENVLRALEHVMATSSELTQSQA